MNSVFQAAMRPKVGGLTYGEAESLREGIPQEPLPDTAVELYALDVREDTYSEEASFVAERIRKMLRDGTCIRKNGEYRPVQPEDIVILLRSPGTAASCFQRALEARGIRCATGAGDDLLKTEEISTLRSFLKVLINPRQDIPLISVLASPVFGFTANDLAVVRGNQKKVSFYEALARCGLEKADNFFDVLQTLRREAKFRSLTSLLEICLRLTRMDSIYGAMSNGNARRENIQMFYQLAADYEKQSLKDLSQFLDYLDSLESRGLVVSGSHHPEAITIMSIHKSKGLEFPVVFLCNLSRRFNMENLRAQILCDKDLGLGLSVANLQKRIRYPSVAKRAISVKMAEESVSEEMRVLYVAMTRARDRLIMTYASQTLENDLKEIVLRQDFDSGELVCREATCMGDWVLLAATQRMEAGALHACSERPRELKISNYPWYIAVTQATEEQAFSQLPQETLLPISEEQISSISDSLAYRYPHTAATTTPSKQTATAQKGREKDLEAYEDTPEPKVIARKWRSPSFANVPISGKEYGNAMHTVMQYIAYEKCSDEDAIRSEIHRIVRNGFLTSEQAAAIVPGKLLNFFSSELGQKLRSGISYLREFKFSILDDGCRYNASLKGEKILLQGVVDCALLEEDGITIIDFKTDYVTEETLSQIISRYRGQVQTYSDALQRIYEKPVKNRYLYLFGLERFVAV